MKNTVYANANPYDLNQQGGVIREKSSCDNKRSNNPYDLNKAGLSKKDEK